MKYLRNNEEVSRQKFYGNLKKDVPDRCDLEQAKDILREKHEITAGANNDMNIYKMEA